MVTAFVELALNQVSLLVNPFRGEFFWFYEVQKVDIFFENDRKLTLSLIHLSYV